MNVSSLLSISLTSKLKRMTLFLFLLYIINFTYCIEEGIKEVNEEIEIKLNRENNLSFNTNKYFEVDLYYKKFNILITDVKNIKSILVSDRKIKDDKCDSKATFCFETDDLATNLFQNSCINKLYVNVITSFENNINNKEKKGSMKVNINLSNESCILENSNEIDLCLTKKLDHCSCSDNCEVVSCGNFSNNKFVSEFYFKDKYN